MASRADAQADVLLGGAGVIDGAAGADNLAFHIFGVDIGFHGNAKPSSNQDEGKSLLNANLMTALCRIENIGDSAENEAYLGVKNPIDAYGDYGKDDHDQRIFD